jgi:hypothetical protein
MEDAEQHLLDRTKTLSFRYRRHDPYPESLDASVVPARIIAWDLEGRVRDHACDVAWTRRDEKKVHHLDVPVRQNITMRV